MVIHGYHCFIGPPSRPIGPLTVDNVTNSSADLSWKQPENNGGLPVTGYTIDYRVASRNFWTNVATIKANTTTFTVTKLMEETDYHFRVAAVNDEGQSQYLETLEVTKPYKKIGK